MNRVTVFAPATVANVAVGFDLLGFPVMGIGDEITLTRTAKKGIEIGDITVKPTLANAKIVEELKTIPKDPEKNSATKGLLRLIKDQGLDYGFLVEIKKGIPLGSGMGGSAASAVGAVVAANRFLANPLPKDKLLSYALVGEEAASGARHADNVAPCLYGGLTATRSIDPIDVIFIPVPKMIRCVIVHPPLRVDTRESRKVLKKDLPLSLHVQQSSNLVAFITGCFQNDLNLIRRSLCDLLIEPQRAHLVAGFAEVKAAALATGAMGCSFSGSGPSVFAWVDSDEQGTKVEAAMTACFKKVGLSAQGWISPISAEGARVI